MTTPTPSPLTIAVADQLTALVCTAEREIRRREGIPTGYTVSCGAAYNLSRNAWSPSMCTDAMRTALPLLTARAACTGSGALVVEAVFRALLFTRLSTHSRGGDFTDSVLVENAVWMLTRREALDNGTAPQCFHEPPHIPVSAFGRN